MLYLRHGAGGARLTLSYRSCHAACGLLRSSVLLVHSFCEPRPRAASHAALNCSVAL
jgi:hypothetical protein